MTFQFNFTADVLDSCINNTSSSQWFQTVFDILSLSNYDITTKLRFAAWIAQCGHESTDFKTLEENLNYRASALLAVFPTHFTAAEANTYQHDPEKIANRVYSNRMGNGNEASGDGWQFHGRGVIQITGRSNYSLCSQAIYGDNRLLTNPELLTQMDGAIRSACWFWQSNNLNVLADASQLESITKRINGGTAGEDDRMDRYEHANSVLSSVANIAPVVSTPTVAAPVSVSDPASIDNTPVVPNTTTTDTTTVSSSGSWFNNISTWWNGGNNGGNAG